MDALAATPGIPTSYYKQGELCGWCVRVACVDTACQDALLRTDLFMVADSCTDCKGDDLLISAGIQNVTGELWVTSKGRIRKLKCC